MDALDPCPRGALVDHGVPVLKVVLAAAGVEEDEADPRVVDETGNHDGVAALVLQGTGTGLGGVGTDVEFIGLAVNTAEVKQLGV